MNRNRREVDGRGERGSVREGSERRGSRRNCNRDVIIIIYNMILMKALFENTVTLVVL